MAPLTLERRDKSWLDHHAHDWINAGLVSETQAEAILHYEHVAAPATPERLTLVAEVASYLGSVIALAGGAAIIAPNWEGLGLVGQAAIAAAITLVGLTVGTRLVRLGEPGTTRLGTFLWMIGTGGVALAVAGIVNEIDPEDEAWFPAMIGIAVLTVGVALWRNLERPLQLLTASTGILLAGGGLAALTDLSFWMSAPILWMASFGFGVLAAFDRVRPRLIALAVAATGLMVASFLFMNESEQFGSITSVVSAGLIVAFALRDRTWPLVALGVVAFFIATTSLMTTVLHGTVARLIAVVLGLVVVAAVAMRAQRSGRANPETI